MKKGNFYIYLNKEQLEKIYKDYMTTDHELLQAYFKETILHKHDPEPEPDLDRQLKTLKIENLKNKLDLHPHKKKELILKNEIMQYALLHKATIGSEPSKQALQAIEYKFRDQEYMEGKET